MRSARIAGNSNHSLFKPSSPAHPHDDAMIYDRMALSIGSHDEAKLPVYCVRAYFHLVVSRPYRPENSRLNIVLITPYHGCKSNQTANNNAAELTNGFIYLVVTPAGSSDLHDMGIRILREVRGGRAFHVTLVKLIPSVPDSQPQRRE
jgi:hypothetical protein